MTDTAPTPNSLPRDSLPREQPSRFDELYSAVRATFEAGTADGDPILLTATDNLFATLRDNLPEPDRAVMACSRCATFVARCGAMVTIDERGRATSLLWDPTRVGDRLRAPVTALAEAAQRAPVTAVLRTVDTVWGTPQAGGFPHLAVTPHPRYVHTDPTITAAGSAAQLADDRARLADIVTRYPQTQVSEAVRLLTDRSLFRAEKVLGPAQWLLDLQQRLTQAPTKRERDNLLWAAAAAAPPGFCNVRSTMLGVLLDDLASGRSFEAVRDGFAAKLDPTRYQRPQVAPSAGNIAAAEKLMAQLQAANALQRRYATLNDVQALWRPVAPAAPADPTKVFGNVRAKSSQPVRHHDTPPVTFTWEKFRRTVLPQATGIRLHLPSARRSYGAMTTAADPDALQIMQWDNPVAWYVYTNGSSPTDWGLTAGDDAPVSAIVLQPHLWTDESAYPQHGRGVLFALQGARDTRWATAGIALFPENLRAEFRPIRATLEAYSKTVQLAGVEDSVAGLILTEGTANQNWNVDLTVAGPTGDSRYRLDRWD